MSERRYAKPIQNMSIFESYSLMIEHLEGKYHGFCSSWCCQVLQLPPCWSSGPPPFLGFQSPRGPSLSCAAASSLGYWLWSPMHLLEHKQKQIKRSGLWADCRECERCETEERCPKLRSRISLTVAWDVPSSGSLQSSVTICWTGFTSVLPFFLLFLTWTEACTSCTCIHTGNKRSHCCKQWEGLQRHLPPRLYTWGLYLLSFDLLGELGVHLSHLNFFLSHRHRLSIGLGVLGGGGATD